MREPNDVSEKFSLKFEQDVPAPSRIPSAPDDLHAFLDEHHRGLVRATVKVHRGRKQYSQLNAIEIGAAYDEVPDASIDEIERAIMAVAQEHFEEHDRSSKFMVELRVYKTKDGKPKRRALHFALTEDGDDMYSEAVQDPSTLDESLMKYVGQLHLEIRELMKENREQSAVIRQIGEASVNAVRDGFKAREESIVKERELNYEMAQLSAANAEESDRNKRMDRAFDLVEKYVPIIAEHVTGDDSSSSGSSSKSKSKDPAASKRKPAWITAGKPRRTEPKTEPKVITTTAKPKISSPSSKKEKSMNPRQRGKQLFDSITDAQWPKLRKELSDDQIGMLGMLQEADSDEQLLHAVRDFNESLTKLKMGAVMAILSAEQIKMVIDLGKEAGPSAEEG